LQTAATTLSQLNSRTQNKKTWIRKYNIEEFNKAKETDPYQEG